MSAPTIRLDGGKYTFYMPDGEWRPHINRYGEPWVVIGDGCNAVTSLMYAVEAAQSIVHAVDRAARADASDASRVAAILEIVDAYKRSGL